MNDDDLAGAAEKLASECRALVRCVEELVEVVRDKKIPQEPANKKNRLGFSRTYHLHQRSEMVRNMYLHIEEFCSRLNDGMSQQFRQVYIGWYLHATYTFCRVTVPRKA